MLLKSSFYVRRPTDISSTIIFALASQHINKTEHFISCFGGSLIGTGLCTSALGYKRIFTLLKIEYKESFLFAIGVSWRSGSTARVIFRRPFARASVSDDCGASRDRSNSTVPAFPPTKSDRLSRRLPRSPIQSKQGGLVGSNTQRVRPSLLARQSQLARSAHARWRDTSRPAFDQRQDKVRPQEVLGVRAASRGLRDGRSTVTIQCIALRRR